MVIIPYCRGVESKVDISTGEMLIKREKSQVAAIMDINKQTGGVVLEVQYVPWDPRLEKSVC